MITFNLNGKKEIYTGNSELSLLKYLRLEKGITSVKDGCSGQAACGACTVEINGKAKLSCVIKMNKLQNAEINTIEGFSKYTKDIIAKSFVNEGAVQCGFCSPGIIVSTKVLLQNNSKPNLKEIQKALKPHICRCTGYKKIEKGIYAAAQAINEKKEVEIRKTSGKIGVSETKYMAYETAIGKKNFVDDIFIDKILFDRRYTCWCCCYN